MSFGSIHGDRPWSSFTRNRPFASAISVGREHMTAAPAKRAVSNSGAANAGEEQHCHRATGTPRVIARELATRKEERTTRVWFLVSMLQDYIITHRHIRVSLYTDTAQGSSRADQGAPEVWSRPLLPTATSASPAHRRQSVATGASPHRRGVVCRSVQTRAARHAQC